MMDDPMAWSVARGLLIFVLCWKAFQGISLIVKNILKGKRS